MALTQQTTDANGQNERLWRTSYAHTSEEFTENEPQRSASYANISDTERVISGVGGGALAAYGVSRGDLIGVGIIGLGAYLVQRGVTGYCNVSDALHINTAPKQNAVSVKGNAGVKVEKSVTINAPVADIYAFWRKFENLPRFMNHLESVTETDSTKSHWVAKAPLGTKVEWDAEIIAETPNELISWRSLEGASVANAGSVHFHPATGGRGTVVKVSLKYDPPGGTLGAALAWLFGEEPSLQVADDLRRFKRLMENNEIATISGQSNGSSSNTSNEPELAATTA